MSDGGFEFKKDDNQYNTYKVVFINGKDKFESQNFYSYNYQETTQKRNTTFFYLDRAIYRPGQIVYFKGLMINTDGKKDHKVVTNQTTTVTFSMPTIRKLPKLHSQLMNTELSTESLLFHLERLVDSI